MSPKVMVSGIVALVVLMLLLSCFFTVQEGEKALALRLGEIVTDAKTKEPHIFGPGLHFKAPFIVNVRKFNVRLQDLEEKSPRILTEEQKYIYVDYYAKWRIIDLSLYYTRAGGHATKATQLLTQKINDSLRAEFGKRNLQEVVADQRSEVMQLLKESANIIAEGLGLVIDDVRIKSIDLMPEVQDSVFKSMSTKREQAATSYRSTGKARAERIRAESDTQAIKIIADAKREAAEARAKGDEEAADIYTKAYKQNAEFYALYRSLQVYRDVFRDDHAIMVLDPKSPFFKYFNRANSK